MSMRLKMRQAAEALDDLEAAQRWIDGLAGSPPANGKMGVRVEWSWGRVQPGYDVLSKEVSEALEDEIGDLIDRVMDRLMMRARQAREAVARELADAA